MFQDTQIQNEAASSPNFKYGDWGPVFSGKPCSQLTKHWMTKASISMSFHSVPSTIFRQPDN